MYKNSLFGSILVKVSIDLVVNEKKRRMYVTNRFRYKNAIPKHLTKRKRFFSPKRMYRLRNSLTLKSFLVVSFLLTIILILPTLIVLPFMNQQDPLQAVTEQLDPPQEGDSSITVSVMRTETEEIEQIPLETYVTRVVASEMPTDFELEALKAQGLAARTYIINHLLHQKATNVTDLENDQVYKDEQELRKLWGENYHENMEKLMEAVKATEGKIITYNNQPITAAYFSTSNGYTENSEDYWEQELPYLRSVPSPWDEDSPKYKEQAIFSINELAKILNIDITDETEINLSRTESNRVKKVTIGDQEFSGREIREKLSLPSSDFSIKKNEEHMIFTTKGFGHGIGMSQYGANGMAKEGKTFEDIIHYYYKDVSIQSIDEINISLAKED